jgi:hypothetical protein
MIEHTLPGICAADPFVPFPANIAMGKADLMKFQAKQYICQRFSIKPFLKLSTTICLF